MLHTVLVCWTAGRLDWTAAVLLLRAALLSAAC